MHAGTNNGRIRLSALFMAIQDYAKHGGRRPVFAGSRDEYFSCVEGLQEANRQMQRRRVRNATPSVRREQLQ